jgi:hypothetical protein
VLDYEFPGGGSVSHIEGGTKVMRPFINSTASCLVVYQQGYYTAEASWRNRIFVSTLPLLPGKAFAASRNSL